MARRRRPRDDGWLRADGCRLNGSRRIHLKLCLMKIPRAADPQPQDIRPSDITARLGAPWLPTGIIEAFAAEVMATPVRVRHTVEIAYWSVDGSRFAGTATSIFLGRGSSSAAMIATNSSSDFPPPSRAFRARSWPMLLTKRC